MYTVAKHNVIGKAITAFLQVLENVFYEFKDRKQLVKILKKNREQYRNSHYSNQRQIVGEIERKGCTS